MTYTITAGLLTAVEDCRNLTPNCPDVASSMGFAGYRSGFATDEYK